MRAFPVIRTMKFEISVAIILLEIILSDLQGQLVEINCIVISYDISKII